MTFENSVKPIRALKPNVTREQAIEIFTKGSTNLLASVIRGRARSISDLYIPYRFFQVRVISSGKEAVRIFALEAFRGAMDLYEFPVVPSEASLLALSTRNVLPSTLDALHAQEVVIARVRRLIFSRGFFRIRDLHIETGALSVEISIPYWVCFRGSSQRVHISVLDAVRRRLEGSRARHLVEEWLHSSDADQAAL
jgi:hypothetical protein